MAIPRPLSGLLYSGGKLIRPDHRTATELRAFEIIPNFISSAEGSARTMREGVADVSRQSLAYVEQNIAASFDLAERLGLPVDAGRIGAYGPNVTVLRDFVRSSRQPL